MSLLSHDKLCKQGSMQRNITFTFGRGWDWHGLVMCPSRAMCLTGTLCRFTGHKGMLPLVLEDLLIDVIRLCDYTQGSMVKCSLPISCREGSTKRTTCGTPPALILWDSPALPHIYRHSTDILSCGQAEP